MFEVISVSVEGISDDGAACESEGSVVEDGSIPVGASSSIGSPASASKMGSRPPTATLEACTVGRAKRKLESLSTAAVGRTSTCSLSARDCIDSGRYAATYRLGMLFRMEGICQITTASAIMINRRKMRRLLI